jgi:flagellar hook-associated protein 3 FlgL
MVFITSQSVNAEILRQQSLTKQIATLQSEVSSGKKYEAPSDNPKDWLQISTVGRKQQLAATWQSNLDYAKSRADQASSSLSDINNLMSRVTELLVTATGQGAGTPGSEAVAQELQGIRDTISSILNQKDYQGSPTFDDGTAVAIPVNNGLAIEAVGTRQSIEDGISTAGGTKSIYDILDSAIAAVRAGDQTAEGTSLEEARAALDHVIVAQSQQGVRSQRVENETTRLTNLNLDLAERKSNLEDTDLTEVITQIQAKLTTLQAAQVAFAKISQQSLFDLIR